MTTTITDLTAAQADPTVPSPSPEPTATRATLRAQARRALIAQVIQEKDGRVPTHLQLLNELRRRGVKTSKGTVMNDLAALGISTAPSAYARKQTPQQS